MERRAITVTDRDLQALDRLLAGVAGGARESEALARLEEELERARIVPVDEVPPDVVTMGSRVQVRDLDSGAVSEFTLAWSSLNAPPGETRVSIRAPMGAAVLGYREGDRIEWPVPAGVRRLQVVKVVAQPEALRRRLRRPA
jgi:regulator of nucleoside diphosphate kinase